MPQTTERRPRREGGAPATTTPAQGSSGHRVTARAKIPTAFVSLFMPSGRRTWHWYWYTCRACGTYQLGRARTLEGVTGRRRAGCGHQVNIVVGRIYGRQA